MKIFIALFLTLFCVSHLTEVNGQSSANASSAGSNSCSIFLHTDRSYYEPGESVSFKAYIRSDISDKTAANGDTLNVCLLDQEGNEVSDRKYPLSNSLITGDLELPLLLSEGNYFLLAHTRLDKILSPEKVFCKVLEIRKNFESALFTNISLNDTIYKQGSQLTANIRFSEMNNGPVPVSFSYQLSNKSGEIFKGKGKAGTDGTASVTLQLTSFDPNEINKLVINPSYKGSKTNTGIVIPTLSDFAGVKTDSKNIQVSDKNSFLNIMVNPASPPVDNNGKMHLEVFVTDNNGNPVLTNLSVSASNVVPLLPAAAINTSLDEKIPGISQSSFTSESDLRKYFSQSLVHFTQHPGNSYIVQEKNDLKKLRNKQAGFNNKNQNGYSADRNIMDIIMQIKPYHISNGSIFFGMSAMNSNYSQEGALIVVDGVRRGSEVSILSTIPVEDIAKINVSTNTMDMQRYSALNTVGIIEITLKKNTDYTKKEDASGNAKGNTLFWGPEIITDKSGKASITFDNNNKSGEVLICVNGIAGNGAFGTSSVKCKVR
jgi:hypothetical protein